MAVSTMCVYIMSRDRLSSLKEFFLDNKDNSRNSAYPCKGRTYCYGRTIVWKFCACYRNVCRRCLKSEGGLPIKSRVPVRQWL